MTTAFIASAIFGFAMGVSAFSFLVDVFGPLAVAGFLASRPGQWVTSRELRAIGGPWVYPAARALERRGLAETRLDTSPEAMARRGGRPAYAYRWRGPSSREERPS